MVDLDTRVSCSSCGYDLMGLARSGNCPECGQAYDIGLGRGVTERSANMRAHERGERVVYLFKLWGMAGAAAVCMAVGGLVALMSGDEWLGPLAIGLLFGGVLAFGAFVTWFTEGRTPGNP
ncbi:MAG: hypothetical protein AAGH99_09410 [Planctomycetota bacterium]